MDREEARRLFEKYCKKLRITPNWDVQQLLGMSAVKPEAQVDLVVHLERWREDKFYDRFGLDEEKVDILGIEIPIVTIPVQPGRNLATIVEVAAMNNRHKKYGFNAAQQLADELERIAQGDM